MVRFPLVTFFSLQSSPLLFPMASSSCDSPVAVPAPAPVSVPATAPAVPRASVGVHPYIPMWQFAVQFRRQIQLLQAGLVIHRVNLGWPGWLLSRGVGWACALLED